MSEPSSPFQETSSPQPQQQMASDLVNNSEIEIQVLSFPGCQQTSAEDRRSPVESDAYITQGGVTQSASTEHHHQRQQQQHLPEVGYSRQGELPSAVTTSGYPSVSTSVVATPSRMNQVQRVAAVKHTGGTPLEDQSSAARAVPALIHHTPGLTSEVHTGSRLIRNEEQQECSHQGNTSVTDTEVELLLPNAEQDIEQVSAGEGRKRRRARRKQVPKKQQFVDSPRGSGSDENVPVPLENSASVTIDDSSSLPPAKRVRKLTARQKWSLEQAQELDEEEGVGRISNKKPPVQWNVEEVADFVNSIDSSCTSLFREHVSY